MTSRQHCGGWRFADSTSHDTEGARALQEDAREKKKIKK